MSNKTTIVHREEKTEDIKEINFSNLVFNYGRLDENQRKAFEFLKGIKSLEGEPRFKLEVLTKVKRVLDSEIEYLHKEIYEEI